MTERNLTDDFLTFLADKSRTQAFIADLYVSVIASAYSPSGENAFDVAAINAAIVERWSVSGLNRVKKMAWDMWAKERVRRGVRRSAAPTKGGRNG